MNNKLIPEGYETFDLKKVKYTKGKVEAEFECMYEAPDNSFFTNSYSVSSGMEPHPDFVKAFDNLKLHAAFLTEIIDEDDHNHHIFEDVEAGNMETRMCELLKKITVTGITYGGSDEHTGVVIVAQRSLKAGKVLNLVTPFCKLQEQEHQDNYSFLIELNDHLNTLYREAQAYFNGTKAGGSRQLEIFDVLPEGVEVSVSNNGKDYIPLRPNA